MSDTTIPAATILIVRDGASGLEVFMVKRHHQIDFVAGALVFPGGKVTTADSHDQLHDYTDGIDAIDAALHGLMAAAIREAFEESGILFARPKGQTELVSGTRLGELASYRQRLETQEISLLEMLQREGLRLAFDRLVHFAHWITPKNMPKRFDTHFFVAEAPAGQIGTHDGRESVDSVWITPHDAIEDRKRWNVIFPTKLNLMKLAKSQNVAAALKAARDSRPLTVTPWVEETPQGSMLRIRDDAGYEQTQALLKESL
jgi:8-oxo-dGTP pyrophosphatase MutT (NUDIX family)